MTQEGQQRYGGDGLGKKEDLEQLDKPAPRRFAPMHQQQQRQVKEQQENTRDGQKVAVKGRWTSEEEAALEWVAVSESEKSCSCFWLALRSCSPRPFTRSHAMHACYVKGTS